MPVRCSPLFLFVGAAGSPVFSFLPTRRDTRFWVARFRGIRTGRMLCATPIELAALPSRKKRLQDPTPIERRSSGAERN